MRRTNIGYYLILTVLLIMTSCNQDYLNEYMVDDKIYLNEAGLKTPAVFNWGTYTHDVYVIKGGKGFQGAQVKLVIDETLLADYNTANGTSYKLMPQECYALKETQLSFGKEDYRKSFKVDFNPEAILKLESESLYALPCRMEILNNSIEAAEADKMTTILVPNVKQPYIKLFNSGLMKPGAAFVPNSDDEYVFYTKVQTNYHNQWDLTYTLEVDAAALTAYNKENNTSYKLLPEAAYEFNKTFWKVPAKWDEQYVEVKLKKQGLVDPNGKNLFDEYILPIRLSSVSMHGIDPDADLLLYVVTFADEED